MKELQVKIDTYHLGFMWWEANAAHSLMSYEQLWRT